MKIKIVLTVIFAAVIFGVGNLQAQTSGFTYQGQFEDSSVSQPTNGTYDMEFALFDSEASGTQIGSTQTKNGVQIVNGIFSVSLDFGNSAFDGSTRYLEITVFNSSMPFILSPRTLVNSSPYAFQANKATTADNTNNVGIKTTAQVVDAVNDVQAATSSNGTNTIVKRGSGGAINVGNININGVPINAGSNTLILGTSNTTIRFGNIPFGAGFIELCVLTPTDLRLVGCAFEFAL